jgi:hypothetical protein
MSQEPLTPTTTVQQDLTKAGQRHINLIWENTQSQIAKVAVYSGIGINVIVIITLMIIGRDINNTLLTVILACLGQMNTAMGIIIGFYFSRTNHSAIGGVGPKDSPSDSGTR